MVHEHLLTQDKSSQEDKHRAGEELSHLGPSPADVLSHPPSNEVGWQFADAEKEEIQELIATHVVDVVSESVVHHGVGYAGRLCGGGVRGQSGKQNFKLSISYHGSGTIIKKISAPFSVGDEPI